MFPESYVSLIAFFSFSSLAMLFWGLAAVVPIIIHLWNRRRYDEVTWAAMPFLLAAVRKHAQRIRIEQLILLATRVLVLLLFTLAITDASCNWSGQIATALPSQSPQHTVLVLDGSYSMAYRSGGTSRFERARRLAVELVERSKRRDGFTLVLMSSPPQTIVRSPAFDPEDVIAELNSVTFRHGGADLPATLAEIQKLLKNAEKEHPRLQQAQVCFFTDLGETTWEDVRSADCQRQIDELGQAARLLLVDLSEPEADNLAITRLVASDRFVTIGRAVDFRAAVKSFGSRQHVRHELQFYVDQRLIHREHVDVEAGSETTVAFTHRFDAPGEYAIRAQLADDSLSTDNQRWLSVPVHESIRALCVSGKPGAARHLAYALEPTRSMRPRVQPQIVPESALLELDLENFHCVCLCNVGRIGPREAGVLQDYLSGGGGLVIFLGDQVVADSYNRELGGHPGRQRILPAHIGPVVAADSLYGFDPLDYRHQITKPFEGNEQSGLLTTPVWRYFRLQVEKDSHAATSLAFRTGDPAIVDEAILSGRSILIATAASTASVDQSSDPPTPWTALSIWPSFPPLVHQILSLAIRGRYDERNVEVGQVLGSSFRAISTNVPLEVVDPARRSENVRLVSAGRHSRWVYTRTDLAGIYEARIGPPISGTQLFAVNVDTRESDLRRIMTEELPSQFDREAQSGDDAASITGSDVRWPLFRCLLGAVLICLIGETWLAWRLGNAAT